MKTTLATAGLLLGALLLPVTGYSADKPPSASPASPSETASSSEPSKASGKKMGHGSSQPVDDTWITTKIKGSYVKDKTVGTLDIGVTTVNGVVELSGEAKTKKEADRAVAIARKIKGVKSVKNNIKVAGVPAATTADKDPPAKKMGRSDQPVDDTVITTKVKAAYAGDKTVSALNTEVNTVNGVVKLTGTAKTKAEADQAVALARRVAGVKSVQNDIKIQ